MPDINGDSRPRLAPGARLQFDPKRQRWLLLAPERVIETEGPVHDIVKLCDGVRSIGQIVDELARVYAAPRAEIAEDVGALLQELLEKRLIVV